MGLNIGGFRLTNEAKRKKRCILPMHKVTLKYVVKQFAVCRVTVVSVLSARRNIENQYHTHGVDLTCEIHFSWSDHHWIWSSLISLSWIVSQPFRLRESPYWMLEAFKSSYVSTRPMMDGGIEAMVSRGQVAEAPAYHGSGQLTWRRNVTESDHYPIMCPETCA